MKKLISLLPILFLTTLALAQPTGEKPKEQNFYALLGPDPTKYLNEIKPADLKEILTVLTADSLEGRETGTEGQRHAAAYIARQFEALGLPPVSDEKSYEQKILLTSELWDKISLSVDKTEFKSNFNFYAYASATPDVGEVKIEDLVFLGYGIDDPKYSDYGSEDLKNKAILIYGGEPRRSDSTFVTTGSRMGSGWNRDWKRKAEAAKNHGAVAVFIIDPMIQQSLKDNKKELSGYRMTPKIRSMEGKLAPVVFISQEVAEAMIGKKMKKVVAARESISEKGKSESVNLKAKVALTLKKTVKSIDGSNVIGFIEGSDPVLKKEYVFITAHYDHLGKRDSVIYHGADDDGSGTSAVIEIARAMALAKKNGEGPKRSVVCMLVSGEEKGLLGSEYYTQFPIFPLENIVADVNIDMIGRVDDAHKDDPNYIYVIGADRIATSLHRINEESNEKFTHLKLDYKYNAKDDPNQFYYRSDHYNFAKHGIPVVFYFNGVHADYHRPTDTIEKINFEKMAKIGQLAFATAWEVANRIVRLAIDKPVEKE